jgi:hypothetical protein
MTQYARILQLADTPWEQGISPTIWQKPLWTRSDSNSHAQAMLVKMAPGGHRPLIAIPIPKSSM